MNSVPATGVSIVAGVVSNPGRDTAPEPRPSSAACPDAWSDTRSGRRRRSRRPPALGRGPCRGVRPDVKTLHLARAGFGSLRTATQPSSRREDREQQRARGRSIGAGKRTTSASNPWYDRSTPKQAAYSRNNAATAGISWAAGGTDREDAAPSCNQLSVWRNRSARRSRFRCRPRAACRPGSRPGC